MSDKPILAKNTAQVRVYYRDTDAGGVVYYARYAEYMEIGRTELLREKGLTAARLVDDFRIVCPVVELNVQYKRSARYDDLLTVETIVTGVTAVRIFFENKIFNQKGELLCEGKTTNCSVDRETLRPVKFPDELLSLFQT